MGLEILTPRQPLPVTPLLYDWSSQAVILESVFRDYEFHEIVERHLHRWVGMDTFFQNLHPHKELVKHISDIDLPDILPGRYPDMAENPKRYVAKPEAENFAGHIRAWASLTKLITFDSLYACLSASMDPCPRLEFAPGSANEVFQSQYYRIYQTIEPIVENNVKKAIGRQLELHPNFGKVDPALGRYVLDFKTEILNFLHIVLKSVMFEFVRHIVQEREILNWEHAEAIPMNSLEREVVIALIEIELGIITSDPDFQKEVREAEAVKGEELSDEEITEIASMKIGIKVKSILNTLGVPARSGFTTFASNLITLSAGGKQATFGLAKRKIESRSSGAKSPHKQGGRLFHKTTRRLQAMNTLDSMSPFVEDKAKRKALPTPKAERTEFTKGGDVYGLIDCTGSTLPNSGRPGLSNLLEAICLSLIDAAIVADRKITLYFYNEGTVKTVTIKPKDSPTVIRREKLQCIGNSAARENDEISTFTEVFLDMKRHSGDRKQKTLIFVSDGGMLTSGDESRMSMANRLKLMLQEQQEQIDVAPVLINPSLDPSMQVVFGEQRIIHVKSKESFQAKHLKELIELVRKYDLTFTPQES